MENPKNYLIVKVQNFFGMQDIGRIKFRNCLVRFHKQHLGKTGDLSFPTNIDIWRNYFLREGIGEVREEVFAALQSALKVGDDACDSGERKQQEIAECLKLLFDESRRWLFPIERVTLEKQFCNVYLERTAVISAVMKKIFESNIGEIDFGYLDARKVFQHRLKLRDIAYSGDDVRHLSLYRAKLLYETLRRVLRYVKYNEELEAKELELRVISLAAKEAAAVLSVKDGLNEVLIKTGNVKDYYTKKLIKVNTDEYIKERQNNLILMAMHRTGMRNVSDQRIKSLMQRLGIAATTIELLELRHTNDVLLKPSGEGRDKTPAFILYNSARLETLIRTFNQRVQSGVYDSLPDIKEIDLSLLTEPEEWEIIFGNIFRFPTIIEKCIEHLDEGIACVNHIVLFLSKLASVFSVYYKRVKILPSNISPQLMPEVFARIYVIKAVREIFNQCLALLGIEPVEFM